MVTDDFKTALMDYLCDLEIKDLKTTLEGYLHDLDDVKEEVKIVLEAVAKRNDYDFTSESFERYLEYLGLTRKQFGEFYGKYPFPRKTGSDAWGGPVGKE